MPEVKYGVGLEVSRALRSMDNLVTGFKGLGNQIKNSSVIGAAFGGAMGSMFGLVAMQAAQIPGRLAAISTGFVKSAIAAGQFRENTALGLEVLLKSKPVADALLKTVEKMAAVTPFELGELITGARTLAAFGFQASKIPSMLTTIGDAAALTTREGESLAMSLEEVTRAIGMVQAERYGEALESLGRKGIVTRTDLAKLGVDITKLATNAREAFRDSGQAVELFTRIMQDKFGGGMERMSKT